MKYYNYSKSEDFPNGVNPDCLHRVIEEYGFPVVFLGLLIKNKDNLVRIEFEDELSSSDKDNLDNLIANYNPITSCTQDNIIDLGPTKINFTLTDNTNDYIESKNTKWTIATTFIYEGSLVWQPQRFSIVASLKKFGATGSTRLYNPINNTEICSIDWTNESKLLLTSEEFFNLPDTETIIELQFKTDDKKKAARLHYMALY